MDPKVTQGLWLHSVYPSLSMFQILLLTQLSYQHGKDAEILKAVNFYRASEIQWLYMRNLPTHISWPVTWYSACIIVTWNVSVLSSSGTMAAALKLLAEITQVILPTGKWLCTTRTSTVLKFKWNCHKIDMYMYRKTLETAIYYLD